MAAVEPVTLRADEYRWSQASRCPRMAVYTRRGASAKTRTPREQALMHRGRMHGRFVADQFAAKYGPEQVLFEKQVHWPGGTLHTDVYVIPETAAFEVKSTTSPESLIGAAIIQNAGEQHFDETCDKGGVILVDPIDLSEQVRPVVLNDELIGRVEAIGAQLEHATRTGCLPDRVCAKPSDAIGNLCPFAATCFADLPTYTPPDPIIVAGEVARLAGELVGLDADVRAGEQAASTAKTVREEIRGELRDLIEPNLDYLAGGVRLKRSTFTKTTYSGIAAGIAAGHLDADRLEPYRNESEQERWTVTATEAFEPASEDYGDTPF